jgi:hypothetical protein
MLFDVALAASRPFDPQDPATWGTITRNEMLWGGGEEIASITADASRWSPQCKS